MECEFYREEGHKIYDVCIPGEKGPIYFSFDKKTIFNFYTDYPEKLTPEQIELFKKEHPELAALK